MWHNRCLADMWFQPIHALTHMEDLHLFAVCIYHTWPPVQHTHTHTHTNFQHNVNRKSRCQNTQSWKPNAWESPPWQTSHTMHYNGTTSHSNISNCFQHETGKVLQHIKRLCPISVTSAKKSGFTTLLKMEDFSLYKFLQLAAIV